MDDPIIVVGGGLAGLAAAARLARAGAPVVVLERRREPGGRARTHEAEGFALTEGAHALYLGGAAARQLRALGIDPAGGTPDVAGGAVLRGGAVRPSPFGTAALLRSPLLGARERAAAGAVLGTLALRRPERVAGQSTSDWLRTLPGGSRVQALLGALARLSAYAGDLDVVPAEVTVGQLRLTARHGVRYVDGGWGTIVSALRRVAEDAGAVVRCGVTAEAVEPGLVRTADGEALRARAVVLAGLGPDVVRRLTGVAVVPPGPPAHAACLDVALRSLPRPDRGWTLGIDEPVYVSAYSLWSRLAPPGAAVVHVVGYGDARRPALEDALDRVQPGWRELVVEARFLPRMTTVHAVAAPAARPGHGLLGLERVLVAADWVGPEGWLADAAVASAVAAADAALSARAGRAEVLAA